MEDEALFSLAALRGARAAAELGEAPAPDDEAAAADSDSDADAGGAGAAGRADDEDLDSDDERRCASRSGLPGLMSGSESATLRSSRVHFGVASEQGHSGGRHPLSTRNHALRWQTPV